MKTLISQRTLSLGSLGWLHQALDSIAKGGELLGPSTCQNY